MARKKPTEQVPGRYSAVPHSVLDCSAYTGASHTARSLSLELMRQHTGSNNGHLQLSTGWLKKRGWSSADVIQRAKTELINRKLVIKTRQGGLNAGPDLWALTWLPISDYSGLDLRAGQYHLGAWHCFVEPPKQEKHTVRRNSTVPLDGTGNPITAPSDGTKTALLSASTIPSNGNNVFTNVQLTCNRKRIVGKSGKSGVKKSAEKILPELIEVSQHLAIRHTTP